ncbi:hypothetical protein SSKA14_3749 [Stenotrophomonas sp. SKA14]|nr:hypothetical protein SSKA14_3749 [Stenotrophomonas sp. SKA14]
MGHTALLERGSGTADMRHCECSLPCCEWFRQVNLRGSDHISNANSGHPHLAST